MSFLPSPIACDICKTIKTPSNHWFYSDVVGGSWEIHEWGPAGDDPKNEFTHLCGQVCAVKALSAWMEQTTAGVPVTSTGATGLWPIAATGSPAKD